MSFASSRWEKRATRYGWEHGMFRYVRSQKTAFSAQALTIYHDGECFYPCIHHTAVGQDRPLGQAETFREHRHNLYHVVVYTKSQGAFSFGGKVVEAGRGTVVCISPGQWHDFVTYRQHAVYSEVTFSFETPQGRVLEIPFEALLQMITGLALTLQPWQVVSPEKAHHLESLILRVTDHAKSGSEASTYCCQFSLACLLDALGWTCTEFPRSVSGVDERLVGGREVREKNYADQIAVDDLVGIV